MRHLAFVFALVVASYSANGADLTGHEAVPPRCVEVRDYSGWKEAIYFNATERPIQAVVVPAVGGRVVHFSLNGENILFENYASQGKTLGTSLVPLWVGGYQCELGPESRGLPERPEFLSGPQPWKTSDFSAKLSGPCDTNFGVALEKDFLLDGDSGDLGVVQRMRNCSAQEQSYCMTDRTVCKGGGFAFFPLNKKSRFPGGWSVQVQAGDKSVYEGTRPRLHEAHILDGVLVVETMGMVTKLGADSDAGWIAYVRGKLLFVKYFAYDPSGNYSDGGNSVEVYFDQHATELQLLSPERRLSPGQEFTFPEKWVLIALKKEVKTAAQARKLVGRIPPSPFGKNHP